MFSDGAKLYPFLSTMLFEDDYYGVERLEFIPVELDGEKTALGEATEVEYADLIIRSSAPCSRALKRSAGPHRGSHSPFGSHDR